MERKPKVIPFPVPPKRENPRGLARRVITTACWLAIGFSVGIIVALKVVGFS